LCCNKDFMTKIMSSLFYDAEFMVLSEQCDFFFHFRLIFQRTARWLRHSSVQHLQLQGMWFWYHFRTVTSYWCWGFHSSYGVLCGCLRCDTTFKGNNYFLPSELPASIFRVEVSSLPWRSSSRISVPCYKGTVSWPRTTQGKELYRVSFLQILSSVIHAVCMWWAVSYLLHL
jgi:hypothetical protein